MAILMQTETIKDITNDNELINVLSWFYDEDFVGNNGKEYLWEEAEKLGYESNQEYVLCHFVDNYKLSPQNKIITYFSKWLDNDSTYLDYGWDFHQIKGNTYTLTLARITED